MGTGTAARLAAMPARGGIGVGKGLVVRSAIDSEFQAMSTGTTMLGEHAAVLPRIAGRAWIDGCSQLALDPEHPYPLDYTLPDVWGPDTA